MYIHLDGLKEEYRLKVQLHLCGGANPAEMAKSDFLEEYINVSLSDAQFIQNYTYGDEKYLDPAVQMGYKQACAVLAMLAKYDGKKAVEAEFSMPVPEFYDTIITYIRKNRIPVPTSYTKLRERVRAYKAFGPSVVISSHYGNQRSKKVRDEVSEALLLSMIAHHNQFEDTTVSEKYNDYVKSRDLRGANGQLLTITAQTVGLYRKNHDKEVHAGRYGKESFYNKYNPVIHRSQTGGPLYLVNCDDNDLDLFFIKEKMRDGKRYLDYYHRIKLYVIFDSYNGYPLGYAFGDTISLDVVYHAYRNAIEHIRQLTGGYYLYHQVVTDRWSTKALKPWLESHAHFTPISLGNKRSNKAESNFSSRWHKVLKLFKGYSGHNITAQKRIDRDALMAEKKDFYPVEQAPQVVEAFINAIRQQINAQTGKQLQAEWLEAFKALPEADRKALSDGQRLEVFGITRQQHNEITNKGIQFAIDGEKYMYMPAMEDYMKHVGRRGRVVYDPNNAESIMWISDDEKVKIMANAVDRIPMTLHEMQPGDRIRLNSKMADKKKMAMLPENAKADRMAILERERLDSESLLQAGVLVKEVKQAAEQRALAPFDANNEPDIYERLYDQQNDVMLKSDNQDDDN
ncbi:hypothetical protein SDC9_55044 [bioreactor metagenome]|uniref:Integrase catalytic domain-containing protein n=1 Tax=bioreactor metagenome TaxID=1076179 RepID=A0A644WXV6_9ZZZZ